MSSAGRIVFGIDLGGTEIKGRALAGDGRVMVQAGDATARVVWQRSIQALAAGLTSLINVLDPHTIVIGGGIAAAGETLFAPLRLELEAMEWRVGDQRVALVPAQLGPRAGAFGAAFRALQTPPFP